MPDDPTTIDMLFRCCRATRGALPDAGAALLSHHLARADAQVPRDTAGACAVCGACPEAMAERQALLAAAEKGRLAFDERGRATDWRRFAPLALESRELTSFDQHRASRFGETDSPCIDKGRQASLLPADSADR
ncbi:hypothetical protein FAZ78_21965 [Cereibacter changlensis]|uniref:Uncharacterized protein n=1 Tax=Cereibacter changlensis TaxID=402884 RepID=A0A4U0YZE2_9RHOB|nr:hypothetical protein [Cereibacter changlensis]TKA94503.1 hypothetical protein FAZ78_21965 [Cereibacter changlensis]